MRGISCRHSVSVASAPLSRYVADVILVAPAGGSAAVDCADTGATTPNRQAITGSAIICKPRPRIIGKRPLLFERSGSRIDQNLGSGCILFRAPAGGDAIDGSVLMG